MEPDVRDAFATSVLIRSGIDGFRYHLLGDDDERSRHAFDERVTMSRFLLDQYRLRHG